MTSRRLQQKGPSPSRLRIIGKQLGGEKNQTKQKNLSSPRASWRTGQIPIGAAVRRARLTLSLQTGFLMWDQRSGSFCFVTTSTAIFASPAYYPVISGNKMETELLVLTKLWGETKTSVLQETLISFYWNLVQKLKNPRYKCLYLNIFSFVWRKQLWRNVTKSHDRGTWGINARV